jgi:hypothetical protein
MSNHGGLRVERVLPVRRRCRNASMIVVLG